MDSGLKINISRHRKPSVLLGEAGEDCHSGSIYNRKKVGQKFIVLLIKLLEGCQWTGVPASVGARLGIKAVAIHSASIRLCISRGSKYFGCAWGLCPAQWGMGILDAETLGPAKCDA